MSVTVLLGSIECRLVPRGSTLVALNGQGRIRTSVARKERQIYSLVRLTTPPPVPTATN